MIIYDTFLAYNGEGFILTQSGSVMLCAIIMTAIFIPIICVGIGKLFASCILAIKRKLKQKREQKNEL